MTPEQFIDKFENARNAHSIPGDLCKFMGGICPVVAIGLTAALSATGGGWGIAGLGTFATASLALAGAPVAALGSIATQQKRTAKLLELQTWEGRR